LTLHWAEGTAVRRELDFVPVGFLLYSWALTVWEPGPQVGEQHLREQAGHWEYCWVELHSWGEWQKERQGLLAGKLGQKDALGVLGHQEPLAVGS
jgi:hypothetical protein